MIRSAALVAVLALAIPLHAEDRPLPEARKPKHADRIWAVESATLGALYAADFTLTARGLGDSDPGVPCFVRGESDPLFGRHPPNGRIDLTAAAQFGEQGFLLRKTDHSRHGWVRLAGRAEFG